MRPINDHHDAVTFHAHARPVQHQMKCVGIIEYLGKGQQSADHLAAFDHDILKTCKRFFFDGKRKGSQHNNTRRLYIKDENSKLQFLINTGAELSVIPKPPNVHLQPSLIKLLAANNTEINTYGKRLFHWTSVCDVSLNGFLRWPTCRTL